MKLRGFFVSGALALALTLTACGGGSDGGNTGNTEDAGPTTLTVGTDTGALLQFDPKTITAKANTPVELTFTNRSDSQPHNLAFKEVITAKTAATMAPGTSETISFTAPAAGTYTYVCTIHPGMEGTMTVQ